MYQLTLNREFNLPVAKLFAAWTDPEVLSRWFAPGDMTVPETIADLRIGGRYRIVMENAEKQRYIVGGKYLEISPEQRLVFTWQWEDSPNVTKVELIFERIDEQRSLLSLHHSEFVDQESCDKHRQGWNGCLANLTELADG